MIKYKFNLKMFYLASPSPTKMCEFCYILNTGSTGFSNSHSNECPLTSHSVVICISQKTNEAEQPFMGFRHPHVFSTGILFEIQPLVHWAIFLSCKDLSRLRHDWSYFFFVHVYFLIFLNVFQNIQTLNFGTFIFPMRFQAKCVQILNSLNS